MELQSQYLGKVSITCNGLWDINRKYDRLCLVHDGHFASYISRVKVPIGTKLENTEYWQPVANLRDDVKFNLDEVDKKLIELTALVQTKLASARIVVENIEERDALTIKEVAPGCEVYIKETQQSWILDTIVCSPGVDSYYKEWHLEADSKINAKEQYELAGSFDKLTADRAICDGKGNIITDTYLTREDVKLYVDSIISQLGTDLFNIPKVIDSLDSNDKENALSANQGRVLKELIDDINLDDIIPEGGTAGQVLTKTESGTEWKDIETGDKLPDGGIAGQVLSKTNDGYAWVNDKDTTYTEATISKAGLMSAEDKTKLDKVVSNGAGDKYLSDDGTYKEIVQEKELPSGGIEGQVLKKTANGVEWATDKDSTYNNATTSTAGLMSATDKQKVDKLQTGGDGSKYLTDNGTYKTIEVGDKLPSGGNIGQVLKKTTDGYEWANDEVGEDMAIDTSLNDTSTNPVQNQAIKKALDGKANTEHTHQQSNIEGLSTSLSNKANKEHTHTESDITGLNDSLNNKANINHTHDADNISGLSEVAKTGSYNDLSDKPTIPEIPDLSNRLKYLIRIPNDLNGNATALTVISNALGIATDDFITTNYEKNSVTNIEDVKGQFNVIKFSLDINSLKTALKVPEAYTLPIASNSQLGGIKVGEGLTITGDGVLSCTIEPGSGVVDWNNVQNKPTFATVATSGSYNDLDDKPAIPTAYTLPLATETALGGIKSGIYIEVNTNGQILQPGEYFGRYPNDICLDFNGTFTDWGYYNVSESATNGPEGEDLSAAGLHCRLISIRSGNVKYIEQILYLYQKNYFYTRYGRLDADGSWTNGGSWVKHAAVNTDELGTAYYDTLGTVKGFQDGSVNDDTVDYLKVKGGIDFNKTNGTIRLVSRYVGMPLARVALASGDSSTGGGSVPVIDDGPIEKNVGYIIIEKHSDGSIVRKVVNSTETGSSTNRIEIDASELANILVHPHDTNGRVFELVDKDGEPVYIINKGTTAERPTGLSSIHAGLQYYDTDLKRPIWWNGEAWTDANGVPLDSSNIATYSLEVNDNADENSLNYKNNNVVLNTKSNNNTIKLIQSEDNTDNRESFILDGVSNIFLKNLINKLKVNYPTYNEFNINLYVEYQVNGSPDASATNRVFDKLWYIEVSNRLEITIQRIQLQHLDDGQDATLSSNVIKFVYTKESADAEYDSPTVTVTNNMFRIENSGDGTKFLNNKGIYGSIPQAELPIDLELSGDGTKALMNDGTYKEVFKPIITGDGTKYLSDNGTYKTIETNNLYEEIDMKVYKIDLTTSTKGILTDDNASKIKAFKADIYGEEPALLYLKTSSNVPYIQYNALELMKSNFVDSYSENKTALLRVYVDEVDARKTNKINNYNSTRMRRVISFDFTSDGKIDTNIYTIPDFSFQDNQSPMLANDRLWAMQLKDVSGVIKVEDFNLVKDYYNDGIVNSAYRTSNYIIPLLDQSNVLGLGLDTNYLRLYMMTEGIETLRNAGDSATFQSLNTINGEHVRIKATLDDDLETLTIVKL